MHHLCYEMECDKIRQLLVKIRWVFPGTPVSSANKTDHHDIIETLLKMALNTITGTLFMWIGVCSNKTVEYNTVKPVHVVTSIRQSPVSKGHICSPVIENFIWIEPLLSGHLSYKATISWSQRWSLNTGLTVFSSSPTKLLLVLNRNNTRYVLQEYGELLNLHEHQVHPRCDCGSYVLVFFSVLCTIMAVSLDCPFLISHLVFSNIYLSWNNHLLRTMGFIIKMCISII